MTSPVFLAPLGLEAAAIRRGVRGATVERIGMGPARATAARVRIAGTVPTSSPLYLVGLGGGLTSLTRVGDVVVGSSIQLVDSKEEIAIPHAARIVDALSAAGLTVYAAPIVSAPRIVHGAGARTAAGTGGAVVVDMESYWCAPLAKSHAFAVCRVVSDLPGQELLSFRTPSAVLRPLRVIGAVARTIHHLPSTTVDSRSVEEADL